MRTFFGPLAAMSIVGSLAGSASAIVLTFQIAGLANSANMPQGYGDRVTALTMGTFTYGAAQGFMPNVEVAYTLGQADPAFWNTGYGDLANVLFEDADGVGTLEIVITADPGYCVRIHSFDMAAYNPNFTSNPTINSVSVLDGKGANLFHQTSVVISEAAHTTFDFSAQHFHSGIIRIKFNSQNLGTLSDDIAIDNIVLSQEVIDPEDCPADITTTAIVGGLGYGIPNCILNNDDFFYYLAQFSAGNLAVADLTTTAIAGSEGYGIPNGVINNDDFFYYLAIFAAGCN